MELSKHNVSLASQRCCTDSDESYIAVKAINRAMQAIDEDQEQDKTREAEAPHSNINTYIRRSALNKPSHERGTAGVLQRQLAYTHYSRRDDIELNIAVCLFVVQKGSRRGYQFVLGRYEVEIGPPVN